MLSLLHGYLFGDILFRAGEKAGQARREVSNFFPFFSTCLIRQFRKKFEFEESIANIVPLMSRLCRPMPRWFVFGLETLPPSVQTDIRNSNALYKFPNLIYLTNNNSYALLIRISSVTYCHFSRPTAKLYSQIRKQTIIEINLKSNMFLESSFQFKDLLIHIIISLPEIIVPR